MKIYVEFYVRAIISMFLVFFPSEKSVSVRIRIWLRVRRTRTTAEVEVAPGMTS